MQRSVSTLGFVLAFTAVMGLASASSTPAASQTDGRNVDAPGSQWISLPSDPPHTSFGTLMPDGRHRGVASADEWVELDAQGRALDATSPARNPPHTSFGTLMPDGTYCGVCVPHTSDDNP